MNYPLEDILFFTKIAESRSLNEAAAKLEVAVSTLSRHINTLEEKLGTQLLITTYNGFELTEDGKKLYSKFAHYNYQLETEFTNLMSDHNRHQITLSLLLPVLVFSIVPPNAFSALLNANPGVKLSINIFNGFDLPIVYNDYDLIIVNSLPENKQFYPRKIFSSKSRLYCNPDYIKNYGMPQTVSELSQHGERIISFSKQITLIHENQGESWTITENSSFSGLSTNTINFMNSGHFIIESVQGNRIIKEGNINLMPEYFVHEYTVYILKNYYRKSKLLDKIERELLSLITNYRHLINQ